MMDLCMENPALLKLALYCEGMQIAPSAASWLHEGREIMRTRAGLGSGLELILPGGLWTNVPVTEPWCAASRFVLVVEGGELRIQVAPGQSVPIQLAPRPTWYDDKCTSGKPKRAVGTLQGTYLGIYPTSICEFWTAGHQESCRYCSVGLNLGAEDAPEKTLDEVLEVVCAARDASGITYVDFNTGHYEDERHLDLLEPLIRAVKRETQLLIGVQTPPHSDLSRYHRLQELGVNRVSFCFELFDPERFKVVCPGKDRVYGQQRFFEAMDYCAKLQPRSYREPWITNGEIIAGLEEPSSTIAAIDRICDAGAVPTVCVFRPLKGTPYAHLPPPRTEDMIPIFAHLYNRCIAHGLPIGVAPNIHVSLVLLPEECRMLSQDPHAYRWNRARLSVIKHVARFFLSRSFQIADQRRRAKLTAP